MANWITLQSINCGYSNAVSMHPVTDAEPISGNHACSVFIKA